MSHQSSILFQENGNAHWKKNSVNKGPLSRDCHRLSPKTCLCFFYFNIFIVYCCTFFTPFKISELTLLRVLPFFILRYTVCPRRNVPDFGRVFLRSNYTDITQNTYIQCWTVMEIMAREVWNFDSYYSLIDYQIHIETGRNMWFL